jgi:hypothetical protein
VTDDTGLTPSEAYLGRLCRKTFLQLWSYPNLFKKPGTERCDLLVVFGEDVLIFSDKHCVLRTAGEPKTNWRRWYRDAILKSARQVAGAERWMREQPGRIYTDSQCRVPFPLKLPERPVFHRILTCRGTAAPCQGSWGGTGSLFVTNEPLEACAERPFRLGALDEDGRMVHVFDEVALDAVLKTLDTVTDFCEYLRSRESFFRSGLTVVATGEDDLLGYYLFNADPGGGHSFSIEQHVAGEGGTPSMVTIDETFGSGWKTSPQRAAKARADEVSYCWDVLIEKVSQSLLGQARSDPPEADVREQEIVVRRLAQENRVQRRMLATALLGAIQGRKRRYVRPTRPGGPAWVFLPCERRDGEIREEYLDDRRDRLRSYCLVAKFLNPDIDDVVGVAVDPSADEPSEDVLYIDGRLWSPELQELARQLHDDAGIFKTTVRHESHHWEFPLPEIRRATKDRRRSSRPERKNKRKASRVSRRKNRS